MGGLPPGDTPPHHKINFRIHPQVRRTVQQYWTTTFSTPRCNEVFDQTPPFLVADLRRPHRQVDSAARAAAASREKLAWTPGQMFFEKLSQLGEKIAGDRGLGSIKIKKEILTLLGTSDRSYSFHPGPNRPVWVSTGRPVVPCDTQKCGPRVTFGRKPVSPPKYKKTVLWMPWGFSTSGNELNAGLWGPVGCNSLLESPFWDHKCSRYTLRRVIFGLKKKLPKNVPN